MGHTGLTWHRGLKELVRKCEGYCMPRLCNNYTKEPFEAEALRPRFCTIDRAGVASIIGLWVVTPDLEGTL